MDGSETFVCWRELYHDCRWGCVVRHKKCSELLIFLYCNEVKCDIVLANNGYGVQMNNVAYKNIYETLKSDILSGKYGSQSAFPSVGALVRKFGVARATVHHALEELAHQGLVSRK